MLKNSSAVDIGWPLPSGSGVGYSRHLRRPACSELNRELAGFHVQHGYALLACMQIAAYNLHLGLLRPEPFWLEQ